MIIDGLPTGSVLVFAFNLLISFFFQFPDSSPPTSSRLRTLFGTVLTPGSALPSSNAVCIGGQLRPWRWAHQGWNGRKWISGTQPWRGLVWTRTRVPIQPQPCRWIDGKPERRRDWRDVRTRCQVDLTADVSLFITFGTSFGFPLFVYVYSTSNKTIP